MQDNTSSNGAEHTPASAETSGQTLKNDLGNASGVPNSTGLPSYSAAQLERSKPLELQFCPICADGSITLAEELSKFKQFGSRTIVSSVCCQHENCDLYVPSCTNEFWTPMQRQASSLHQVSYRACFKPELARFYIERLSKPGQSVLDPFGGRGTSAIEAALLGRIPLHNDLNPVSWHFTYPRLHPPSWDELDSRLQQIDLTYTGTIDEELLVFFHPETLREIYAVRNYLQARRLTGEADHIDEWICMVTMNRLTGQSNGFLSVITMPPTSAVSTQSQRKINERKNRVPEKRDLRAVILKKSRRLLRDVDDSVRRTLAEVSMDAKLMIGSADDLSQVRANAVDLVVTSPPFLNAVDYAKDNWLRCWFLNVDPDSLKLTVTASLRKWREAMTAVLRELRRVLKPGGYIAFEVGEVQRGKTKLEQTVIPCGLDAGLAMELVMINVNARGGFTKESH